MWVNKINKAEHKAKANDPNNNPLRNPSRNSGGKYNTTRNSRNQGFFGTTFRYDK